MPTYALKDFEQTVGTGLGTWTYTVAIAGLYHISSFINLVPPTGVSVAIQQNGSNIITTGALNTNASEYNLDCFIEAAVSDVITIVISTANSPDLSISTIKAVMNLRLGS